MPKSHTVVQGECLSSIAAAEGFRDWRIIYNDPANADFRSLRPNPNVIYPGDVVVIPDKNSGNFQAPTGQSHTYTVGTHATLLRLQFPGAGDLKYRLTVGNVSKTDTLAGGTILQVAIDPQTTEGEIVTWPSNFDSEDAAGNAAITWQLTIGHLDPVDTISGYQARLKNLGYNPGAVDGDDGPLTKAAVKAFQADQSPPLAIDGICGPLTQQALITSYGT